MHTAARVGPRRPTIDAALLSSLSPQSFYQETELFRSRNMPLIGKYPTVGDGFFHGMTARIPRSGGRSGTRRSLC
ncbi:hypothetical protein EGYY_06140 [Eggerthella sp. YY7918]|nr:hypothetical protein EGYY_06140 [Eggerthella sp. YY7918]